MCDVDKGANIATGKYNRRAVMLTCAQTLGPENTEEGLSCQWQLVDRWRENGVVDLPAASLFAFTNHPGHNTEMATKRSAH